MTLIVPFKVRALHKDWCALVQFMAKCQKRCSSSNIKQEEKRLSSFWRVVGWKNWWAEKKVIDRAKSCRLCHPIPWTQNHSGWHQYATKKESFDTQTKDYFPNPWSTPNPNGVQRNPLHWHLCKLDCLHLGGKPLPAPLKPPVMWLTKKSAPCGPSLLQSNFSLLKQ